MDPHRSHSHRSTRASLLPAGSTFRAHAVAGGYRQKSFVLETAVTEYLKLRKDGAPVDVQEFCERYPDYRKSLRRLIEVEEYLTPEREEAAADFWPEIGTTFLGCEILDLLGAGSIASVFLASEIELGGRLVALKVSRHGGYEAETLGKLRHPNIVEVYSVRHDPETALTAVSMPYQGSATLSDVLDVAYSESQPPARANIFPDVAQKLAITEPQSDDKSARPDRVLETGTYVDGVVHIGIQLAAALQYAHDRGILHRDLKPSNVLLTPEGRPMLLDFNLSFDAAINVNPGGGTLPYAAPEQLRECAPATAPEGMKLDVRADVFSLGVILYELLTGKLPFGSPSPDVGPRQAIQMQLSALEQPAAPVASLNKNVDAALAAVIHRCLEYDSSKRFSSMSELEEALRRHFRLGARTKRWVRRHPLLTAAPFVLTLVLVSGTATYLASLPPYHVRQKQLGIVALTENRQADSIRYLTKTLDLIPNDAESLYLRGIAFQSIKEHERAVADFDSARKKNWNAKELSERLGYSQFQLNRVDAAIFSYDRAIKNNPDNAPLYVRKAYCIYVVRQIIPEDELKRAVELDNNLLEAYLLRSIAVFQVSRNRQLRFDSAINDIQKAYSLNPEHSIVAYNAAVILAAGSSHRPELESTARSYLEQAVRLGVSRKSVETNSEFRRWNSQGWFATLLDKCSPGDFDPNAKLPELIMTPPTKVRSL